MVKKLLQNGEPCAKCVRAEEMLRGRGVWDQIDEVVWAKEGDAESAGAQLGRKYGVDLAPFFIIERPGEKDEVVESVLGLIKQLSSGTPRATPGERGGDSAAPVEPTRAYPAPQPRGGHRGGARAARQVSSGNSEPGAWHATGTLARSRSAARRTWP